MKKSLLNGLLLIASLSLSLQAAVTTQGLKKFYDCSVNTETKLYLGTTVAVQGIRLFEDPNAPSEIQASLKSYDKATDIGLILIGKPSDIVGSALELPKSWRKVLSQELATSALKRTKIETTVLNLFTKTLDTALFNKVNELVNAKFPGAHQQMKRRVMRLVTMATARYFVQLIQSLVLEINVGKALPMINSNRLSSWEAFHAYVIQNPAGEAVLEHLLTECAGAALAQLIDDSQAAPVV